MTAWNRETLHPLLGLPLGLEYCVTKGAFGLDDYQTLFAPRSLPATDAVARSLKVVPGRPILYQPRRAYDLWGTRYIIVPIRAVGWAEPGRDYAAFLPATEVIYPKADQLNGPDAVKLWADREDWQILRNKDAYPRAWIVHDARFLPPATDDADRDALVTSIIYPGDPFWSEPGRSVHDLRSVAWIETDDSEAPRTFATGGAVGPDELVRVIRSDPQRVELEAVLDRPGLVVLAETDYPGWHLTIDGQPAPILRANRAMRAAAVTAGRHTLIYTYDPLSFRVGLALSALGLAALLAMIVVEARGRDRGFPTSLET